jgi:catecholate siderophore receptor
MRGFVRVILFIFIVTMLPAFAFAQVRSDSVIVGTVVDTSGGVVVGAAVTYRSGAIERTTTTDASGKFSIETVAPDTGTLTVTLVNFEEASQAAVPGVELRVVLRPDGLAETVTVNAAGGTVRRVTSATKTDTLLRDVPQAVSVVSQQLMADQRMQSMADVVRYMPGVGIAQGEGNRDTPILRGNSTTSDFFVDGVRDDAQYFRDVYNVERVEALKGPNAMIFGRGGVGGVINRVSRQADWMTSREVGLQVGSWDDKRLTADLGTAFGRIAAGRVTTMYQSADSYRSGVGLERFGINPTVAVTLGARTTLRAGYEYFQDDRTADRGISSFGGRPVSTDASTFFGDPDRSTSAARVHMANATVEHRFANGTLVRNRVSVGNYDKFYQNVFPGAVNAAGTSFSISAYNNQTYRTNLFNQTDVILAARTGAIDHAVLAGAELGRQVTDNLRLTGFFTSAGPNVTTVNQPLSDPRISLPLEFRPNGSDADNRGTATVSALYAQDQLALSDHVQAVVGLRVERFQVDLRNNRSAIDLQSSDLLLSPRAGLIVKPTTALSLYGNVSLAYLPRAGEQLASLSLTNQALDPERFTNYEVGAKWDFSEALAFTAAVYRLDRSNVAVPDPLDPTRSLLIDAQRTNGVEIEMTGRLASLWSVAGGYAYQDGSLTQTLSPTAPAGATLGMLPTHSVSFWNKVDLSSQWEVGLGLVHRGDSFTSVDNAVVLPAFTRADAGVFYNISSKVRAQLNVENLFDRDYYASAHSNTNITPGSPRAVRVSLTTRF